MRRSLSLRMLGLRADARTSINLAARYGFEAVEILVRDLLAQQEDPRVMASLMGDLGLQGGTWPLPVNWKGGRDDFESDLARLPSYARTAAELGLDCTGTWVLPEVLDSSLQNQASPFDAAMAWHIDRLDAIAAILGAYGQRLSLEAIGLATFQSGRGLRFIDRIDALFPLVGALRDRGRNVGVTVDAFHLFAARESIQQALRSGTEIIGSVHLSGVSKEAEADLAGLRDDQRTFPTPDGPVANPTLLQALIRNGYTGYVFAEPVAGTQTAASTDLGPKNQEAKVQRAAEALRSVWPTDTGNEGGVRW